MAGNGVNLPPNFFLPETAGERSSTASAAGVFGRAVGQ
jgi:hypothetical protein